MIEFRQVTLTDRDWIVPMVKASGEMGCEYSFSNIFMWSSLYATKIARAGNFLTAEERVHCLSFLFPAGTGSDDELKDVLLELRETARREGCPFRLHRISSAGIKRLDRIFPGQFELYPNPADFDYIYRRDNLATLAGKKYHGKRNHIARFMDSCPDWQFEPINENNAAECIALTREWLSSREDPDPMLLTELRAIHLGFDHFKELNLTGGLLRCGGKVIAYTFGEPLNDNTFVTHVEKATPDIQGAYPMINREFAANLLSGYEWINREEDLGLEGLRKAKQSYHPDILYEKYVAILKEDLPLVKARQKQMLPADRDSK